MAKFRQALPTLIAFCIAQGNQLTGIVSKEFGYGLWALAIILASAWVWSVYKEWQATVGPEVSQQIQSRVRRVIHLLVLVSMAVSISYFYYAKGAEIAKLKEENSQLKQQISLHTASDVMPPTISITAPAAGSTVAGSAVTVSATATDDVGVVGVQFKLDGTNLGAEVTAAPYTLSWNTTTASNGLHTLSAVARDAASNTATAVAVSATVVPASTITSFTPTSGPVGTNVTISGTNFTEATVVTFNGVSAAPFTVTSATAIQDTVPTGATTGPLSVTTTGGTATSTSAFTVTNTAPDTTPPTVAITAPAAGATVAGTITVSANATDNVGVVGVQYKLDGANLGAEETTNAYSLSWNTMTVPNGIHTLTAVARDATGNAATTTAINVRVENTTTLFGQ